MNKPSKASLAREVRKLKQRAGWDPSTQTRESVEDAVARLDQECRTDAAYGQNECADCRTARQEGDPSALCADHLAAAMGF
jgi:hypothetical protein